MRHRSIEGSAGEHVVSNAERLKEAEPEHSRERLKRTVAYGARASAQATTDLDAARAVVVAEGRPKSNSGRFKVRRARVIARLWARALRPGLIMRELFALAWPIAAAMLGETAMGLVDTKLVGGLGAAALGGTGLATTLMFLGYSLVFGVMRGVKVRASHAIGEGNPHHAFAYARAGLALGTAFGLVVLVLCRNVEPLLLRLGADAEVVPYARDFLAAITLGAPSTCALSALIQHRQATGDSRTPMVVGVAGNLFNALFAWTLIYGRFGLPALGVRGAGYATATTETLELVVMLALFLRDERRARGSAARPSPRFAEALREVTDLGFPTGIQFAAETLAFTTFALVLSSIGTDEIAANQLAINVIRVSFLPGIAIAEAGSVLVGRALGRRRLAEADTVVRCALVLAVGFMTACGLGFAFGGGSLAKFFSTDHAVIATARKLLLVAALFQVLDAVNIVLRGALRGAKDVRAVALLGVLVVWTFVPTSAWLLGKTLGLGALGGWIGFVGETTFGALLFSLRWRRGGWRRNY
jgi:MATE family multidrug resistance protein